MLKIRSMSTAADVDSSRKQTRIAEDSNKALVLDPQYLNAAVSDFSNASKLSLGFRNLTKISPDAFKSLKDLKKY